LAIDARPLDGSIKNHECGATRALASPSSITEYLRLNVYYRDG